MSEGFQFKQFYVRHDRCAMKVGTDGVLLGALLTLPEEESRIAGRGRDPLSEGQLEGEGVPAGPTILDIGCGTGLIALMLAQRSPDARITAIDIDPDAAAQAADNFAASPWAGRLTALCGDVRELATDSRYDVIACNPPFYTHSPGASTAGRDKARRADTLAYEELAEAASRLLADSGHLEVILPYDQTDRFIHHSWLCGLHLERRIDIRTKPSKPFKRTVLRFCKNKSQALEPTPLNFQLFNADGTPTDEYRTLTADFYIKL